MSRLLASHTKFGQVVPLEDEITKIKSKLDNEIDDRKALLSVGTGGGLYIHDRFQGNYHWAIY